MDWKKLAWAGIRILIGIGMFVCFGFGGAIVMVGGIYGGILASIFTGIGTFLIGLVMVGLGLLGAYIFLGGAYDYAILTMPKSGWKIE